MSAFSDNSFTGEDLEGVSSRATEYFTKTDLDLPGIVWFEHLNLDIGKGMKEIAYKFYRDVLGCTPDLSPSFHLNLGKQQFHLGDSMPNAHNINGSVGLAVPCIAKIKESCKSIGETELKGTKFKIIGFDDEKQTMSLTGPFGNTFHLYQMDGSTEPSASTNMTFMEQKHLNIDKQWSVAGRPGIKFIELVVKDVTAVCKFYEKIFGCNIYMDEKTGCGVVQVGPGSHFIFNSCTTLSKETIKKQNGVHVCCYVSSFRDSYEKLKTINAIWTNPRFERLDKCDLWEDAYKGRQYRFKDISDDTTSTKIFELEHEIRAVRHYQYMKDIAYAPFTS